MGENNSERYIVAFEIGSSKIRGAVGVVDHSGVVDIVATEEEKLTDKVRYGCIQNVEVSNALSCVVESLVAYQRVEPRQFTGAYGAVGRRWTWRPLARMTMTALPLASSSRFSTSRAMVG